MKGFLHLIQSDEKHELANVSIIGRSEECQVALADPRVSRRHAMIRVQDGGFYLFDLGSFNGTYLNGARVTAARRLTPGDVIAVAEHEFRFEQDGGSITSQLADVGGTTIALIKSTPVIILVSDIKSYTAISEAMDADELAQIIGSWYSDVEQIVSSSGGTVDKFIGDCVLAYWTKTDPESIQASLSAAAQLFECCRTIQAQHQDRFDAIGHELAIGLALHVGKVALGGLSQSESTLVGDPVNLTFRLESLTRELKQNALVSGDFNRQIPSGVAKSQSMGIHQVKGRAQGVEVHALTDF